MIPAQIAPLMCCTDDDVERPWLLRFGHSDKADFIGCSECVFDMWLGEVRRLEPAESLAQIADNNIPEVRRLGTFKVGDRVRAVIASDSPCYDPLLVNALGEVVDRSQWPMIDADDDHDVRVRLSTGQMAGHYADFRADELELVG